MSNKNLHIEKTDLNTGRQYLTKDTAAQDYKEFAQLEMSLAASKPDKQNAWLWAAPALSGIVTGTANTLQFNTEILKGYTARKVDNISTNPFEFRAQKAGTYLVGAYLQLTAFEDIIDSTTAGHLELFVQVGGTDVILDSWHPSYTTSSGDTINQLTVSLKGQVIVPLKVGDVLQLVLNCTGTGFILDASETKGHFYGTNIEYYKPLLNTLDEV